MDNLSQDRMKGFGSGRAMETRLWQRDSLRMSVTLSLWHIDAFFCHNILWPPLRVYCPTAHRVDDLPYLHQAQ
jgi:hypothetical protein